jgi:hypothetical protein
LSREKFDATGAFDDLSDGSVARRDDRASGMPASGFGASELRDMHVLRAIGADREGRTIRDVFDEITIGVNL